MGIEISNKAECCKHTVKQMFVRVVCCKISKMRISNVFQLVLCCQDITIFLADKEIIPI